MRKYYIDNIRWITIALVVIYHVIFLFNGVSPDLGVGPFTPPQYQDAIQYILYPWFMILLFLIAGMCSRYYLERHTIREFIRTRTRKLLVPSTIGILLFGWIQGYVSMTITNAFSTIPDTTPKPALFIIMDLSGTGVLWFIQMLWFFSMILALVRKKEKGRLYAFCGRTNIIAVLLLVIPVWLSGMILNTPIISVYRFGIYGFVFFLGYFLFAHEEVIDRISRYSIPLIVAAIALAIVYLATHFGDNYAVMPTVNCIPAVAYAWAACLAILGGMKKWGDKTSPFSAFMSTRSFGLYVFHYLPLSATAYVLHKYALPALPTYLLTGVAAFAGGLLLYEIIRKIPVIRFCLLGIKKDKDNKKETAK